MKKLIIIFCFLLTALGLAGCAKGEVVMELSRFGSANIECRIVAAPLVASQLGFLKDDFVADGFQVENVTEEKMEGFLAKKQFPSLNEVNKTKIMRGFELHKNKEQNSKQTNNAVEAKQPAVIYTQGLLFDTVAVKTHLDLRSNDKESGKESQWLIKNLLQQVNLRFVLKLPTAADSSNATRTPDGGKTLVWELVMGENNELQAQVTYLNPYKAGGWALAAIGTLLLFRLKRRRKSS